MSRSIEDFALLGDSETAALLNHDGSIGWLCWPRYPSRQLAGSFPQELTFLALVNTSLGLSGPVLPRGGGSVHPIFRNGTRA